MKKWLTEHLICPECIENETPLAPDISEETDEDIIEGILNCPGCGNAYTVNEGIAVVVPKRTLPIVTQKTGYNSHGMLTAYLWSHFSEFFNGANATDAYGKWAACFKPEDGWALDIGCSVGRLTFELSKTHTRSVGIDTSFPFIRAARELMNKKRLEFSSIVEGRIEKPHACDLDPAWRYETAEFIVADATALPFRSDLFRTAASINILEKVPHPIGHLKETNRVLEKARANFIFSDPFSWDEAASDPDLWIGGRNSGPYAGRGMDNLVRMLENDTRIFQPGFSVLEKGEVNWQIRKTRNLWEHITSQFVIAERNGR